MDETRETATVGTAVCVRLPRVVPSWTFRQTEASHRKHDVRLPSDRVTIQSYHCSAV